jgi:hypothetical protein
MDARDFVGAAVTVALPGRGEQPGVISGVVETVRSAETTGPLHAVLEESIFRVTLNDGEVLEAVRGRHFTQWHLIVDHSESSEP